MPLEHNGAQCFTVPLICTVYIETPFHNSQQLGCSPPGKQGIDQLKMAQQEEIRARICKPFDEPRNRFPAWRAGRQLYLSVQARQATYMFTNTSSGLPVAPFLRMCRKTQGLQRHTVKKRFTIFSAEMSLTKFSLAGII